MGCARPRTTLQAAGRPAPTCRPRHAPLRAPAACHASIWAQPSAAARGLAAGLGAPWSWAPARPHSAQRSQRARRQPRCRRRRRRPPSLQRWCTAAAMTACPSTSARWWWWTTSAASWASESERGWERRGGEGGGGGDPLTGRVARASPPVGCGVLAHPLNCPLQVSRPQPLLLKAARHPRPHCRMHHASTI
jgi:hypothetical protein